MGGLVRRIGEAFRRVDRRFQAVEARHSLVLLRYSLAFVMLWYGFAKPLGISPADAVVRPTFQAMPILPLVMSWEVFFDLLGVFEGTVGLLLLFRRTVRIAVGLLAMQMASTFAPFVVAPGLVWTVAPFVPTTIGLYIVKNFVLATSGFVLATTVRPSGSTAGFETKHTMGWLRIGIAIAFVWSGLLTVAVSSKPGLWMAAAIPESMIAQEVFIGLLGVLEVLIGIYAISGTKRTRHLASYLALAYLVVSLLPAVVLPGNVFVTLPIEPSFEGVYIFKDLVLVSSVLVVDAYHSFEWDQANSTAPTHRFDPFHYPDSDSQAREADD